MSFTPDTTYTYDFYANVYSLSGTFELSNDFLKGWGAYKNLDLLLKKAD